MEPQAKQSLEEYYFKVTLTRNSGIGEGFKYAQNVLAAKILASGWVLHDGSTDYDVSGVEFMGSNVPFDGS